MTKTGRCLCGKIQFLYEGPEIWRAHCHFESCRRQTASPFTTFLAIPDGKWRWMGDEPAVYVSSPGVRRLFCSTCGTPVAYNADRHPVETHFYASLLDEHADFIAERHLHWEERVAWVEPADNLPRR